MIGLPRRTSQRCEIHRFGGKEVLQADSIEPSLPDAGQALVAVHAASVNPVDFKIRSGKYPAVKDDSLEAALPGLLLSGVTKIETADGHVGNLGGAPRAVVEFRSDGAVVDVFGLALAPSFLRAICSIPSFGIAKFAVNVWSPDTNKNANKTDRCSELLLVFSMHREKFPENQKSNQYCKLLLLLIFSGWCPWPAIA